MAVSSHIWKEVLQCVWRITRRMLAAAVGFEPTELSFNGFQDRHLKPLGHAAVFDTQPGIANEYRILKSLTPVLHPVSRYSLSQNAGWQYYYDGLFPSWLTVLDLNQRMQESNSWALPLGERSILSSVVLSRWPWLYINITNSKCQYQIFIFLKFLLFQNCFI